MIFKNGMINIKPDKTRQYFLLRRKILVAANKNDTHLLILCNVQIWGWDPGFWIRYSVTQKNSIPDPGTGVYKALDTDEVTSSTLTEGKAPFQL